MRVMRKPASHVKRQSSAAQLKGMRNRAEASRLVLGSVACVLMLASASHQLLAQTPQAEPVPQQVRSILQVYDLETGKAEALKSFDGFYEAPYWSRDGSTIYFNGGPDQKIYRMAAAGGATEIVEVGDIQVVHDHGFSLDGKWHAVNTGKTFQLCLSGADGKGLHPIGTAGNPLYMHHWSPDSRWMAGARISPDKNFDVYRISVDGKDEQRLTTNPALDDGPDYSPDGRWIYFNSNRAGSFDIWRMPATGAGPGDNLAQQVTSDAPEDWFPHPSPDGKWLLFLSFAPGTKFHDSNREVTLRIRTLPGNTVDAAATRVLVHLVGGQGSLNLNSWAPDSHKFAYMSYEVVSK